MKQPTEMENPEIKSEKLGILQCRMGLEHCTANHHVVGLNPSCACFCEYALGVISNKYTTKYFTHPLNPTAP